MPGLPYAFLVGAASGVLAGMFGIGGGLVTTPAIRLLLGAPALIAVGTPLPVIIPTAAAGALSHLRHGTADVRAGTVVGLAAALPAIAGAWLSDIAGGRVMMLLTAALLAFVAYDTVKGLRRGKAGATSSPKGREEHPGPSAPRMGRLVVTGVLAGLYSGLLGLGGGFVVVPLLSRWISMPFKRAIGTSLVAVAILAVPGTVAHALLGHVDWRMAAGLAAGGIPGAYFGGWIASRAEVPVARIGFATMLVVAAVALSLTELAGSL